MLKASTELRPVVGKMLVFFFFKGCLMNELLPLLTGGGWGWIIFKILFLDLLKSLIKNNACISENILSPCGMLTLTLGGKMIGPGLNMAREISLCSHLWETKLNCETQSNSIHQTLSDYYLPGFMQSSEDTEKKKPQCLPLRSTCPVGKACM